MKKIITLLFLLAGYLTLNFAQTNTWLDLDTIKAGRFDTGKMWTFEDPPIEFFEDEYNFKPDEEWFDHVRLAALRFATYCSAAFVSEDGLIITNHHCARQNVTAVTREGENLHESGFISNSLEEERKAPGLFVDQLVLIEDVTEQIQAAIEKGSTEEEKLTNKYKIIEEIEERISEETNLDVSVTSLYEGSRYSAYGYKRYNDVRLVFSPEEQLGSFGGDIDNFTYPRYCLDFSLFRVYDDGKPLKSEHYYKWSKEGPKLNEPVFVAGNPGTTNRLKTVAQLEYYRDISYPRTLDLINGLIETYRTIMDSNPERRAELEDMYLNFTNSQKVYAELLNGLRDPVLMQRKVDFENKFKSAVMSNPKLTEQFGGLWNNIEKNRKAMRKISNKKFALSLNQYTSPAYFFIAEEVISIAKEIKHSESTRDEKYSGENLEAVLSDLMPEDFDYEMQNNILKQKLESLRRYLGSNDELVLKMTGGYSGDEAVKYILSQSSLTNVDDLKELIEKEPDDILNGTDPFIYFVLNTESIVIDLGNESDELTAEEEQYNSMLGRALYEVYGTSIPPDATFTLRLSDGVVKDFPYNGTIAPTFTTFYGLYNRYYSFNKEFPWNLPERWINPPSDFDLSTPFNFVTTNDLSGGSSGSAMINKEAEVVGVAFDGNMQSIYGGFIYRTEQNRAVGVHSAGILEALRKIYKVDRLVKELETGKLSE